MISLCRAQGVISFETTPGGGYKVLLGPQPQVPGSKAVKDDPRRAKRALYLDQLGRTLSDEELDLLP